MNAIDHLGIAVKSLAEAKSFYETLGLKPMPEETVAAEQVRLSMVPVGESRIESAGADLVRLADREVSRQARRRAAPRRVACG